MKLRWDGRMAHGSHNQQRVIESRAEGTIEVGRHWYFTEAAVLVQEGPGYRRTQLAPNKNHSFSGHVLRQVVYACRNWTQHQHIAVVDERANAVVCSGTRAAGPA